MGEILVYVHRIDLAPTLGGDVALGPEEGRDGRVADLELVAPRRLPRGVGQEVVQCPHRQGLGLPREAAGAEVAEDDRLGILGLHAAVEAGPPPALDDFDERGLVAHSHAPDPLQARRRTELG